MQRPKKVACPLCNRLWKVATERMKAGKTCSKLCSSIKGYLGGDRKETGIELKLQQQCTDLGLPFETQKPLLGICVADIFIPPNIALFADGTYWHSGDVQIKDAEITRKLKKGGYVVGRFTEEEIDLGGEALKNKVLAVYARRRANKEL